MAGRGGGIKSSNNFSHFATTDSKRHFQATSNWRDWLSLLKVPISLMNALSAAAGFLIFHPQINPLLFWTTAGVFLLACGSAALNNYQDRQIDQLFSRTRNRPLPLNRISTKKALGIAIGSILIGLAVLFWISFPSLKPVSIGIVTVILYNGVYTPLKRWTVLAIVPGSLCGMLPPLIGWVVSGGVHFSLGILTVMVILGIWQLPHAWLLLMIDEDEFQLQNIPNMLQKLTANQLNRIMFVWILSFGAMAMLLPLVKVITTPWIYWLLAACMIALITLMSYAQFVRKRSDSYTLWFRQLNIAMGLILSLIIIDKLKDRPMKLFLSLIFIIIVVLIAWVLLSRKPEPEKRTEYVCDQCGESHCDCHRNEDDDPSS
jgi:protoheme IX farnesyltransferase